MRSALAVVRRFYGAHPAHLLSLLACFAVAGYAVLLTSSYPMLPRIATWFGAAVVAHDLVLFPAYALADRSLHGLLRRVRRPQLVVSPLNYIRVPVLAAALLLLVFLPGIIEQGHGVYVAATGHTRQPFLGRWLLATAALFATSAACYVARSAADRRRRSSRSGRTSSRTGGDN